MVQQLTEELAQIEGDTAARPQEALFRDVSKKKE